MSLRPPEDDLMASGGPTIHFPRPPDAAVLVGAAIAGVVADLSARSGLASLATALLVASGAAGLILSGRVMRRQAVVMVLGAAVFGACLAVRSSPWLIVPDTLVAFGLLAIGSSLQSGGHLFVFDVPACSRR